MKDYGTTEICDGCGRSLFTRTYDTGGESVGFGAANPHISVRCRNCGWEIYENTYKNSRKEKTP